MMMVLRKKNEKEEEENEEGAVNLKKRSCSRSPETVTINQRGDFSIFLRFNFFFNIFWFSFFLTEVDTVSDEEK